MNRKAGGLFCFVFAFVKRNCFIKKKGLFTQSKTPKCKEACFGFHVGTEESLTHQAGCKCRQVGQRYGSKRTCPGKLACEAHLRVSRVSSLVQSLSRPPRDREPGVAGVNTTAFALPACTDLGTPSIGQFSLFLVKRQD